MMKRLFDQEYATEQFGKACEAEGREKGRAEGREEGREETLVSSIKSMMKNLGLSLQKTLDALGITDSEERTRLAGMMR